MPYTGSGSSYTMFVIKCNNKNVRDSIIITIGFSILFPFIRPNTHKNT